MTGGLASNQFGAAMAGNGNPNPTGLYETGFCPLAGATTMSFAAVASEATNATANGPGALIEVAKSTDATLRVGLNFTGTGLSNPTVHVITANNAAFILSGSNFAANLPTVVVGTVNLGPSPRAWLYQDGFPPVTATPASDALTGFDAMSVWCRKNADVAAIGTVAMSGTAAVTGVTPSPVTSFVRGATISWPGVYPAGTYILATAANSFTASQNSIGAAVAGSFTVLGYSSHLQGAGNLAFMWKRVLSPSEAQGFKADPTALFSLPGDDDYDGL